MGSDDLLSRFGEPEGVYRPSPGQTAVGVFLCAAAAIGAFAAAVFGCGLDVTNRVCAALLGAGVVGLGVWLYRLRKWRFVIFTGGLVQVRPGGVDELRWEDVREVVQTRIKGFGESTARVTLHSVTGRVVVNPVNFRSRAKMFRAIVEAAERRNIPVRVEWESTD